MESILQSLSKGCVKISNIIRNTSTSVLEKPSMLLNASGDSIKMIDQLANDALLYELANCIDIHTIFSEEMKGPLIQNIMGNYMVTFDPLDGSSNINVNHSMGTIFAIFELEGTKTVKDGESIICAGYYVYGSSTQAIIAREENVSHYQYSNNKWIELDPFVTMPHRGKIYSINESNRKHWNPDWCTPFIDRCIQYNYSTRWDGCLATDAHRILLQGGFFCYPSNSKYPQGRLRLLYEAYPMAYIFEMCGGMAITETGDRILSINFPVRIHTFTSLVLCSAQEYEWIGSLLEERCDMLVI